MDLSSSKSSLSTDLPPPYSSKAKSSTFPVISQKLKGFGLSLFERDIGGLREGGGGLSNVMLRYEKGAVPIVCWLMHGDREKLRNWEIEKRQLGLFTSFRRGKSITFLIILCLTSINYLLVDHSTHDITQIPRRVSFQSTHKTNLTPKIAVRVKLKTIQPKNPNAKNPITHSLALCRMDKHKILKRFINRSCMLVWQKCEKDEWPLGWPCGSCTPTYSTNDRREREEGAYSLFKSHQDERSRSVNKDTLLGDKTSQGGK